LCSEPVLGENVGRHRPVPGRCTRSGLCGHDRRWRYRRSGNGRSAR
jgi:hypothetical protein